MKRALLLITIALAVAAPAEIVPITILHLNDIYEITPVAGGKEGGMARVATLRKQLLQANPRTYTILAGDCFSPSALGTALVSGKPIAGAQMVAAMNAAGFDFATFGNHEFDLTQEDFLERLKESRFRWVSSNVHDANEKPFPGVAHTIVFTARLGDYGGSEVRIGLIGVTLDSNRKPWVGYADAVAEAISDARELRPKVDILIAVTHLAIKDDQRLAAAAPELDLILGGHEHENVQEYRGTKFTPILKADANARSVYVVNLSYDTEKHRLVRIEPKLERITDSLPEDPATAKVVHEWVERGMAGFRANGFKPEQVVALTPEALDGRESVVRNTPSNLTDVLTQAMLHEAPDAELAILNSGAIRIDDEIPPGPITQYDVLRILPFGGKIVEVQMTGKLLQRVLEDGEANRGKGGYLLVAGAIKDNLGRWGLMRHPERSASQPFTPLDPNRTYKVAIADFLMTGLEQGLEYLKTGAPGVVGPETPKRDIRFAVIEELQRRWPAGQKAVAGF